MAELMLVNPRKRKTKSRKRRSPAQKAATAKMLAANRRRRGSRSTRQLAIAGPRRRKRRGNISHNRRRVSTRRRYARNPIAGSLKGLGGQFMEAGIMAGGAFGLDVLTGFVMPYIPAASPLRSFPGRHVMKGACAIGLGMLAGMVTKGSTAKLIATGGLVNVLIDAMRTAKVKYAPDIRLGDADPMGMWMDPNLGYLYQDQPDWPDDNGAVDGYLTDQSSMPDYLNGYNSAESY